LNQLRNYTKDRYVEKPSTNDSPYNMLNSRHLYDAHISWPKISIVTPSYNQGQFIEQTIKSVLNQGYPNLEYILIDGGSTDETLEIINKYESNLTYWISEKDEGQANAINKGLRKCNGDIFNWLNSDDYYEPLALYKVAKTFINHDCDIVSAREKHFDDIGNLIFRTGSTLKENIAETLYFGHIDQPSTFWRKEIIDLLGGVNEKYNFLMDAELWVRYLLKYGDEQIIKLNEMVVSFRLHDQSKTFKEQTNFKVERASLRYSLLKSIGDSKTLESLFEPLIDNSKTQVYSINKKFDKPKFLYLCAEDLFKEYYYLRLYLSSKKSFIKMIKINPKSLFYNILYFLKLFLIPKYFLNFVRSNRSG